MGLTLSSMEKTLHQPRKLVSLNICTREVIQNLPGVYEQNNVCIECFNNCCHECCDDGDEEIINHNKLDARMRAEKIIDARPITSWMQISKLKGMSIKRVNKMKLYAEYETPPFPTFCPPRCDASHMWKTSNREYKDWEDYRNNFPPLYDTCVLCGISTDKPQAREICKGSFLWKAPETELVQSKTHQELVRVDIPNKGIFMRPKDSPLTTK